MKAANVVVKGFLKAAFSWMDGILKTPVKKMRTSTINKVPRRFSESCYVTISGFRKPFFDSISGVQEID
jgi:hypothetical protein